MLSTLFAATTIGFLVCLKISATALSKSVIPVSTSTTKTMALASSIAISTCLLISPSKISSEPETYPPVSITENSFPFHSDLP